MSNVPKWPDSPFSSKWCHSFSTSISRHDPMPSLTLSRRSTVNDFCTVRLRRYGRSYAGNHVGIVINSATPAEGVRSARQTPMPSKMVMMMMIPVVKSVQDGGVAA